MYGESTIYYQPENFGLETVGEFSWEEPDYDFNILVVWKESRGRYWIGEDSGCSCPVPFEEFTDMNMLDGPYNKDGLRKRLDWLVKEHTQNEGQYRYDRTLSRSELQSAVTSILARLP